jgi:hypothetical protein
MENFDNYTDGNALGKMKKFLDTMRCFFRSDSNLFNLASLDVSDLQVSSMLVNWRLHSRPSKTFMEFFRFLQLTLAFRLTFIFLAPLHR